MAKTLKEEPVMEVLPAESLIVLPEGLRIEDLFFSYLNERQNAFVRALIKHKRKPLPAFREVYKNNMADNTATVAAYKKLQEPGIRLALAEIAKMAAGAVALDLSSHLASLADLRDKAVQARQFTAAIAAEIARGKAAGLYVQRMELTGKDGAPLGIANVPLDEFKAARDKILQDC